MAIESDGIKELDFLLESALADAKKAAQELLEAREEIKRLTLLTAFHCYECGASFQYETEALFHGSKHAHGWLAHPKVKSEHD